LKVIERIDRQVDHVLETVRELRNERSYRGIERLAQLLIQALLDLGIMAISAVGGRMPKGYSEVGELLLDMSALSEDDARLLKSMAGMRNILVHAYAVIDRDIVKSSSKNLVKDAPRIAKALRAFLEGRKVDPPPMSDLAKGLDNVFRGRVKAALFFGGRMKGYLIRGDYDIAVYFGKPYSFYDLGELVVDIAKVMRVQPDKLDVVSLDSAAPEIVLEALEGKPIYIKDPYVLFELRFKALMELLDLRSGLSLFDVSELNESERSHSRVC